MHALGVLTLLFALVEPFHSLIVGAVCDDGVRKEKVMKLQILRPCSKPRWQGSGFPRLVERGLGYPTSSPKEGEAHQSLEIGVISSALSDQTQGSPSSHVRLLPGSQETPEPKEAQTTREDMLRTLKSLNFKIMPSEAVGATSQGDASFRESVNSEERKPPSSQDRSSSQPASPKRLPSLKPAANQPQHFDLEQASSLQAAPMFHYETRAKKARIESRPERMSSPQPDFDLEQAFDLEEGSRFSFERPAKKARTQSLANKVKAGWSSLTFGDKKAKDLLIPSSSLWSGLKRGSGLEEALDSVSQGRAKKARTGRPARKPFGWSSLAADWLAGESAVGPPQIPGDADMEETPWKHPDHHVDILPPGSPKRYNIPGPHRKAVMYHTVMPDPRQLEGFENWKTGERSYFRKISDGATDANWKVAGFQVYNPIQAIAASKGQKRRYSGVRPAKWEERMTTGVRGFSSYGEWYKITPKTQNELRPGLHPWSLEDLGQNLMDQNRHFESHDAGQDDSVYAGLDRHMLAMCHVRQCHIKAEPNRGGGRPPGRLNKKAKAKAKERAGGRRRRPK